MSRYASAELTCDGLILVSARFGAPLAAPPVGLLFSPAISHGLQEAMMGVRALNQTSAIFA